MVEQYQIIPLSVLLSVAQNDEKLKKLYEHLGFTYFQTSSKTGLLQYYKKL